MRVIVISVALLIAFVIMAIGFVKSERTPYPVVETVTTVVENPFADDIHKDKQVALPTLPPSASASNSSATSANTQSSNEATYANGSATVSDNPAYSEQTAQATMATGPVVAGNSTSPNIESSNGQLGTGNNSTDAGMLEKPRKLGLAMLELEKEKRKNLIGIIVNQKNTQELSESEVKAMYLDRLNQWRDGSSVLLFNLPLGDKYRDKFSQKILNMTALDADQAESARREAHVNKNRVQVKASNIVVSYVEQHTNAIAYVPLSMVYDKSNVRVVLVITLK